MRVGRSSSNDSPRRDPTTRRSSPRRITSPTGVGRPTSPSPASPRRPPGSCAAPTDVVEDDEGITLTSEWVEDAALNGLYVAHALGRFAGAELGRHQWLAVGQLRDRLRQVERRGGWPTLARTTVADVADRLWARRETLLRELDALPQVPQHGDPAAQNLPGRQGDDVVAIDWGTLGTGPVGADLGLFLQNAREDAEPLLDAYLLGLPPGARHR